MTEDEKLALVFGYYSSDAPWKNSKRLTGGLEQSAGYVAGNARLGIRALSETDAGIGVASQPGDNPRMRTALPSNLATAGPVNQATDPRMKAGGGTPLKERGRGGALGQTAPYWLLGIS